MSYKGEFVHLHNHTEYSLLDGSGRISDVIGRAKELGMSSIAITDHGVMYGCVEFYKAAAEQGIKPIIGCEVYVASKSMLDRQGSGERDAYHLVLLVKNETGYENLMSIVSKASIEGFYYKPRTDHEFLKNHSEGLIALSACLGGEVQSAILDGNRKKAEELALFYKELFKDGFYLELQEHGIEEQREVNRQLIDMSQKLNIPLVATNDCHYVKKEDARAHDILLCIQTGKTINEEKRMRFPTEEFYIKSPEEMYELFKEVPEALSNTAKIAEECNFNYEFHKSKLPKFPLEEGVDAFTYMKELCYSGLRERYDNITQELTDRLEYELGVIKQMGYVDYFLIVWDFIRFARENGIMTGPGRGCFLPNTKILMADGTTKNIQDISAGDTVISAFGNALKVNELFEYDCDEEITCIEACNEKLFLTEDHKVLAVKTKPCQKKDSDTSKLATVCRSTCSVFQKKYCKYPAFIDYNTDWISAKDLSPNDMVLYPRNKSRNEDISFDLLEFASNTEALRYDDDFIWYEIGSNALATTKIKRHIPFDDNLAKIMGYYISEGWAEINEKSRKYRFGFGFNREETDYINEVKALLKECFNIEASIAEHKTRYSTSVTASSKVVAKFLIDLCGKGANNKHIPYDIIEKGMDEYVKTLVSTMFRGDGSYSDIVPDKPNFRIKYTTTSRELVDQLRMLLARHGYWASIKIRRFKSSCNWHEEYGVCISGKQLLHWNDDFSGYTIPVREQKFYRNDGFYLDDSYIYIKIKKVSKEKYKGKVYDLSVPPDVSYVAGSMAVHNSGAGSIVAYTLGITKIDPIKYNLIFERFLNPERVSMPDIDSDFCYERRGEVIDYVVQKYGVDNVSQIVTFGTMAAKACIRDVGRAMNYSYAEVDKIAKMIPFAPNMTINKAIELNPELKGVYEEDERVKALIDVAKALEGLPRHTSTHAAGVVIASQPLVNYVPLQKNEDNIVTQFTMGTLEELGLLKMDFLGLRTLTVIRDAVRMVKENKKTDIDIDHIDYDDKDVYRMIGEGKTVGVFQLESAGMTSFMKELKPDNLEDIIAGISLYRPGPMAEIPRYIQNKKNPELIKYDPPELEHILDVTYGCMVYQEQVMQIVRDLAGYSMGRSDLVRRAMSKKKHKVMEEERKNFVYGIVDENNNVVVPGCIKNGISEESANRIFDSMMDFASYAFNKSHAAAYAVVGFQTAYLMHYYPTEYIAAMLNSNMGNSEKIAFYIRFANSLGIKVLPPDINESFTKFTVKENTIRFGLAAVKNAGFNVLESIIASREEKGKFIDLTDFCSKVDASCINKRVVESLIKAGAFDCFNVYRSKMLAVYEKLLDGINNDRKKNIEGQINLFSGLNSSSHSMEVQYPEIKEFDKKYLLAMEKEMTGLYLSGHPLEEYEETLNRQTNTKISDIVSDGSLEDELVNDNYKAKDGDKVIIGGIITDINRKITKNNDMMAFILVEDLFGTIEVLVFPKTFEKCKGFINMDAPVIVSGRVSIREEEQPKIICDTIEPMVKINSEKIYIQLEEAKLINEVMTEIKPMLLMHKGNTPVYIFAKKERSAFRLARELWISNEEETLLLLKQKFGEINVKVV